MKNPNPDLIEVTYHERASFKAAKTHSDARYMARVSKAKTKNKFVVPGNWYVLLKVPNGFKLKVPGMEDKKLLRADKVGHICVTGVEPGTYDITEQTEDYLIAKKQKP